MKLSDNSERLHVRRGKKTEVPKDGRGSRTSQKWLVNERPTVELLHFTYTNYQVKSVNSDVKSVRIHPQWGCRHWPYGTLSESP